MSNIEPIGQANVSADQDKSNAELFSDWLNQRLGRSEPEAVVCAEPIPVQPIYPTVRDGGEIMIPKPKQSTADLLMDTLGAALQENRWR